jgi:UDP-glucose 4-epimerase
LKIAIVGNTGFIGGNLTRHWISKNDELICFNSQKTPLTCDEVLNPEFAACDVIIWTAGRANPTLSIDNIQVAHTETTSLSKTIQLLNYGGKETNKRFIFLSSGGCTYTGDTLPYREVDEALGTNYYGKMKLEHEAIIQDSLPNSVVIRLANVYGIDQPSGKGQGVIAEWFHSLSSNLNPKIFGSRNSYRDYIYVTDAASAIVEIAKSNLRGIVNVGSGKCISLYELEGHFKNLFGDRINFDILEKRNFDRLGYYLSIDRLRTELNWAPKIDLELGLQMMHAQYLKKIIN